MNQVIAKRDIGLMTFIIAVCIAVLVESWDLPPGTFEPLGSGPVPQAVAFFIIGLCTIILVRAAITLIRHNGEQKTDAQVNLEIEGKTAGFRPRPWSAMAVLAFSGLYITILYLGVMGFGIVTVFFIFGIIMFLIGMEPLRACGRLLTTFDRTHLRAARPVLIAAAIALIMGFGCEIVFTKVFYIDLPTG